MILILNGKTVDILQEDPVKELEIFGFTPNQAKVYLSIVRAGSISGQNRRILQAIPAGHL